MTIIRFLQSFASPFWDGFFEAVTMLGEEYFYIFMLALVFWCVDKRYGYKLSFALLLSGVINGVVKSVVRAPRPIGTEGIRSLRVETATGSSFPSGHTQNATTFFGSLMKKLRRTWLYLAGSALILLVAVSRLYLGVHWPLDVLGGMALGVACLMIADFAFERFERLRWGRLPWLNLTLLVPTMIAAYAWRDATDHVKVAGTLCGFLMGFSFETAFVRFGVKAPFWKHAVKFTLGIVVALALKEGLKHIFPQGAASDFLRYVVVGMWITVGAPLSFIALRLAPRLPAAAA